MREAHVSVLWEYNFAALCVSLRGKASAHNIPVGCWSELKEGSTGGHLELPQHRGKFKMQAHRISGVVMDIAAFKVRHRVIVNEDATALRAARASSSSIGAMEESSRRAHPVSVISVHVGVDQRCRAFDVKSSALPTMSTRTFQRGAG